MNSKNRSILKFSIVPVAAICLALLLVIIVRSPATSTRKSSLFHASLLASSSLSGSSQNPTAGLFFNGSGWALTTAGLELTANRGASFSLVQTPVPVVNVDDVALSGSHVSIAGVINSSPFFEISSNSGGTWKSVPLPPGESNAGRAQFVTEGGVILGMLVTDVTSSNFSDGEWYATPNGGATWRHYSLPSGGVITSVGRNLWLAAGPRFTSLYRSTNFGATWSKVVLPKAASTHGQALSLPGQLKNGNVVLVATRPTDSNAATFGVAIFISRDNGINWSGLARTTFTGQINSGVTVASAVSAKTIWLGESTDQGLVLISSLGKASSTIRIAGVFSNGSISSIIPTGNSSAWITTMKSECLSDKTSCSDTGGLISTVNAGRTWSGVKLVPKA